jgi:hypothetical protein
MRTVVVGGGKTPSAAASLTAALVTGDLLDLVLSTGMNASREASGSSKIEDRAPNSKGNRRTLRAHTTGKGGSGEIQHDSHDNRRQGKGARR